MPRAVNYGIDACATRRATGRVLSPKVAAMLLYVDVLDACHLKCPTCVRGVRAFASTSTQMPLEQFRQIVAKGKSEGAHRVDLFNWTEPFLYRNIHEYVAAVKELGLPCGMSSTLSIKTIRGFAETLKNLDMLTISMSGFEQEV